MNQPFGQMELMRPDELEAVVAAAPVAFVPLGALEHAAMTASHSIGPAPVGVSKGKECSC